MERPIGIFDSGVGGLSVAKAIQVILPNEHLLYIADHQYSPYGIKSPDVIEQRAILIVKYLIDKGCKAIVVACNTATVSTINKLRHIFSIPIIGVEPGLKPALLKSKTHVVGVLATEQTLRSHRFKALTQKLVSKEQVILQACPKLITLVESNNLDSLSAFNIVREYITPMLDNGADQIVLGCTHFSFLSPIIETVIQDKATLVDTAQAIAQELHRQILQCPHQGTESLPTTEKLSFLTTGTSHALQIATLLWGKKFNSSEYITLNEAS